MPHYPFSKLLFQTTAPTEPAGAMGPNEAQTGKTYVCSTSTLAVERHFVATISLEVVDAAAGDSASIHLETSPDGSLWVPAADALTQSGDGVNTTLVDLPLLLGRVRARTSVAGESKLTHKATVLLSSNADFRLKAI